MLRSEIIDHFSDDEASISDTLDHFEDNVITLRDFSFISVSKNGLFFTMHRLVQLTTSTWLKSHVQTEQWRGIFISKLCYKLPTGEYDNWKICRQLFPHVKAAMSQQPESRESLQEWATLLYKGAWYASQSVILADARNTALKSRQQRVGLLGEEHEDALDSAAMLARAWSLEGRWEEAEKLEVQLMEIRKMNLGEDHPSTLTSTASLALAFWHQGRWDDAEQLQVQVMRTSKSKLGDDHPDTLNSMANLAFTLKHSGQEAEALYLLTCCIAKQRQILGPSHWLTSANYTALMEWLMETSRLR